jgi:hypothetical protein
MERRDLLMMLAVLSVGGVPAFASGKVKKGDCTYNGFKLFGKVQIVDHFPDLKIQVVDHFPDLKVQKVEHFPNACGQWQIVDHFADLKVQIVDHFPDLKIQWVDHFPGVP